MEYIDVVTILAVVRVRGKGKFCKITLFKILLVVLIAYHSKHKNNTPKLTRQRNICTQHTVLEHSLTRTILEDMMRPLVWIFILIFLVKLNECKVDPYATLGLQRSATPEEIRQAYRMLAKRWHPDKNKASNAEQKFLEINEAYNLLSNPKRRKNYDMYGWDKEFEDDVGPMHYNSGFGPFTFPFFHYGSEQLSYYKYAVDLWNYEEQILPSSATQPFLLFIYADFVPASIEFEPSFQRIVSELEPTGYGIGTVNALHQTGLVNRLPVRSVPGLVAVVNGRAYRCALSLNEQNVLQFARSSLPSDLFTTVTDELHSIKRFRSNAIAQNHVAVLVFGKKRNVRLRMLLLAFRYRRFCSFGYVQSDGSRVDHFYIYNDASEKHEISLNVLQPMVDLNRMMEKYKLLRLPRLSSQFHYEAICPTGTQITLCVVLIVTSGAGDQRHVDALREQLLQDALPTSRVVYAYVYEDLQANFVQSIELKKSSAPLDSKSVVLIWRQNRSNLWIRLLGNIWSGSEQATNRSVERLKVEIGLALKQRQRLKGPVTLLPFRDENGPGLYKRLATNLIQAVRSFYHQVSKEEVLPIVSVFATIAIMFIFGGLLNYVVINFSSTGDGSADLNRNSVKKSVAINRLLNELRAETYFGMVRLLKPGFRTLVVLCDQESKSILLKQFGEMIWPWRQNKTLMFGYVMVEKNLNWFRRLLELTVADCNLENINARNVIGTVLALNGFRQYYSVYHPKYSASMVAGSSRSASTGQRRRRNSAFLQSMELESDCSDSSEEERRNERHLLFLKQKRTFNVDELLQGLPNWLDRLFEGSVKRFYISEWPPMK
ncbi:DnaJ -like protein subfamily C member 16 [Trichinella pseudospiralis]|uniref:DnaJ-like protein subfamily C member 16 n=1 Tax=Trichinella pseudospiralis TaxID=6337 RepID=A0A0V1EPJ1_TRIPS|nr:DnaJ -like protein subfamily C member 16 [Trichinella pseudospiralis]